MSAGRLKVSPTLALSKDTTASSRAIVLIAIVLAIGAIYFGRQIFIPLALALVLSFLLNPLVSLLEKILAVSNCTPNEIV